MLLSLFQASEFFHRAQSSATSQQREFGDRLVEGSMDSPLLLEQVFIFISCFMLVSAALYLNSISLFHNIPSPYFSYL